MNIIVGLGNPGREYAHTPHNAGFMVIEALAARLGCALRSSWRLRVRTAEARLNDRPLLLVQPRSYMNCSGPVVAALLRRRGATVADLLVVVDDADLPLGSLRLRRRGSSGGHKGLQSLVEALGTEEFPRLRIGIGRGKEGRGELAARVLGAFTEQEWTVAERSIRRAVEAVLCAVQHGLEPAMNRFNVRVPALSEAMAAGGGHEA